MSVKIEPLHLNTNIRDWFERYNFLCTATAVEGEELSDAKVLANFIARCDGQVYKTIKSLVSPEEVDTKTFEEVKNLLLDHLSPKPTKFAMRYKFHKLAQKPGQSVASFVAELRTVGKECEYNDQFEEALLDRFLVGLQDSSVVSDLLVKEDLTFADAVREVLSKEQGKQEAQIFSEAGNVNRVKDTRRQKSSSGESSNNSKDSYRRQKSRPSYGETSVPCEKCGLKHKNSECTTKCFACGEFYHISKNCPKRDKKGSSGSSKSFNKKKAKKRGNVNQVSEAEDECELEENLSNLDSLNMYYLTDTNCDDVKNFNDFDSMKFKNELKSNSDDTFDNLNLKDNISHLVIPPQITNHLGCQEQPLFSSVDFSIDSDIPFLESDVTTSVELDNSRDVYPCINPDSSYSGSDLDFTPRDDFTISFSVPRDYSSSNQLKSTESLVDIDLFEHSTTVLSLHTVDSKPIVHCKINRISVNMEFDTGSSVSVISCETAEKCGLKLELSPSERTLRVANGQIKAVKGCAKVDVTLNNEVRRHLTLFVVNGYFPSLFGRSWIDSFCGTDWLQRTLNIGPVSSVDCKLMSDLNEKDSNDHIQVVETEALPASPSRIRTVDELRESRVFKPGLGLVKGVEARLILKEDAKPVMLKARNLPYAIKDKVEEQLQSMCKEGILRKIEDSPWGTPVVPVRKSDGQIRICGDYKSTLNPGLSRRQYPIPSVDECFAAVSGGRLFSVVDIKQGYNNMMIRESDQILTTLNTHKGLYVWQRLPFGISSSCAIFQGVMDDTLRGIEMCCCRIDDILITGRTDEEHLANLNLVIERLESRGLKCKLEKSKFFEKSVVYLGHLVSAEGIKPVGEKVDKLKRVPPPKNVEELISFLGAVNYYRRYLPNLSTVIAPLDRLRTKGVEWQWTDKEQRAFLELKEMLCSEKVLTLYNPGIPLKLDTDASSYGVGAVLSHVFPNREERPIEFMSRTLSVAEKKYAQIDREALAIVWAIKKCHVYLYGVKFTLVTDHKALTHIFGSQKAIPEMSANRITRWALFLMNYQYDIEYRNTKDHCNADMLSRLPMSTVHSDEVDECVEVFSCTLSESMLDSKLVASHTKRDPILGKVLFYIIEGWPKEVKGQDTENLKPYFIRRSELSVELDCITWGSRVVIPTKLRKWVLQMIHSTHIGIVGMKSLARSYVYWPGIDTDIEEMVKSCSACGRFGKSLPKMIDHPWTRPTEPFHRVHIDFCGPFMNSMWLILQDAFSKWPEVVRMNNDITSAATIKVLRSIFSHTGVPRSLVSDNGSSLVSEEMEIFLRLSGIKHITVPTYSPKSNGLCERFVGTFKTSMKKMFETNSDVDRNLSVFLLTYRNTPHSTTGVSPAVRAFNRTLRFNLTRIRPADRQKQEDSQVDKEQVVLDNKYKGREREFEPSDPVFVQLNKDKTWLPATVVRRQHDSSNTYDIEYNGRIIKKHADSLKKRHPELKLKRQELSEEDRELLRSTIRPSISSPIAKSSDSDFQSRPEVQNPIETVVEQPSTPFARPSRTAKTEAMTKMKGMQ